MSLVTNEATLSCRRLSQALDCLLRPAVGFQTPFDVLKDPALDVAEKRAILASWASDASAVPDRPTQRWLLGADEPTPLGDVLEALRRLDDGDLAEMGPTPPAPPRPSRRGHGVDRNRRATKARPPAAPPRPFNWPSPRPSFC